MQTSQAPKAAQQAPRCTRASRPNAAGETIHLQDRQFLKLRQAAGWRVKVLTGSLWITQDGDTRDIVLAAGDSVRLDRDGLALFSSFGTASFRLCRDAGAPPRPRLGLGARLLAAPPAAVSFA